MNSRRDNQGHYVTKLMSNHFVPVSYTTRPNTFFLINKKKCMKISDPYIDLSYSYKIAGSCNGLLCLVSDSDEPVLIYNPITRESQTLPKQCYRKFRYDGPLYGLGYDSFSQKYKVVCVYNTYKKLYNEEMTVGEIISEGEACWRKLEIPFQIQFEGMPETVFVNEAFHWIIDRDYQYSRGNSCPELILALNICDEKFHTFKFPPVEFPDSLSLLNFEESLAIAEYNRLGSEARVWKRVGTGTYDQLLYPYTCKFESVGCYHRVVGMLSDGSFVYKAEKRVSFDWYTRLALYNPEEKQSLIFKLCYFNNTSHVDNTIHTVLFTPTLVSPKTIYFPSNPYPGELEECQSESESDGWRSWFSFYVKGSDSESDESISDISQRLCSWMIDRDDPISGGSEFILALDISTKKFHTIHFPPNKLPDSLPLINLGESLACVESDTLDSSTQI
ncbi:hypothetical protein AQUCO_00200736v1 [Aquilegia coerulea]|uniref:F-box associated beta-propeller type 3 domain-containing protein n=1 Tax=Aquilegia coerulea TaxID=218851 RepID=A0A2G5F4H5_AQUCA|nr:hypothetical protein AQUCO_00200736v1 [Aquilegia coerulea]